ncbi:MAG: ImmA/IrrE family metallo-endopeptidase [Oscillatoria sp. PMC 1051.18]|uniref:ImmA/IrrE family metallo-endopeptidase n=1 Tax=Oscillatoria salina TaxID=331517 RepID=UPI0013BE527D|nr:ImmA/IrrE family metallo-endopeptidase [Oscillatoria salina]MBZ8181630.1 ImmA/IrrE family metallo-endopeptidase [Oscillatoria salina IIICB1]MEC4893529.1 ImmA/IrrE family metallo-endopeptidase [Oscillatoria sp. PMC 1050.18]MEC5030250.1 ImmA/IrrE family metallo-endopeptidase [Oscillatoria sp. PMC 1051.18]NET88687.1 ImmA/IrrE family metallo-endopeptidase [Kamptonema sp. SIO1D9]
MSIFKPFRFISKPEIEAKATEILVLMEETPNYVPKLPLDASRVAEFLGLDVVWDSIPADEEGAIAARILPLERLIEINENIPQLQGGFGESTIAHEIGHWVLHIDKNAIKRFLRLEKKGVKIKVDPLLCRSAENLAGIEWQAQYFASCLLMPQYQLTELKKGCDLTQWRDLYAMAEELGVTISNLIHRLKDLGWIYLSEGSKNLELGEAISREKNQVLVS